MYVTLASLHSTTKNIDKSNAIQNIIKITSILHLSLLLALHHFFQLHDIPQMEMPQFHWLRRAGNLAKSKNFSLNNIHCPSAISMNIKTLLKYSA